MKTTVGRLHLLEKVRSALVAATESMRLRDVVSAQICSGSFMGSNTSESGSSGSAPGAGNFSGSGSGGGSFGSGSVMPSEYSRRAQLRSVHEHREAP
jgi:hypothetical protein